MDSEPTTYTNEFPEGWGAPWVYDCGWRRKETHPYLVTDQLGFTWLQQPIGVSEFFQLHNVLPDNSIPRLCQ